MRRNKLLLFVLLWALFAGCFGCDVGDNDESDGDADQDDEIPEPITCEGFNEADYPEIPAVFEVLESGDRALMYGYVTSDTPDVFEQFIEDNPDVEVLIMPFVPGSEDDYANIEASRMAREAGYSTCVPSQGLIASGGVDFFVSGARRSAVEGAMIGVHSWSDGFRDGSEYPVDSPEHRLYLEYYEEMGIPAEFYWFTLEAAPANGIHWMTREEVDFYELLTD